MNLKVYLLGASLSTSNMGVGALAHGLMRSVLARFDTAEIYLLDYGVRNEPYLVQSDARKVSVQPVNMRFSKKLYLANNIALLIALACIHRLERSLNITNSRIVEKNATLNRISEADIIGAISGGDSFSDIYGLPRFFYVALPQLLVLLLGKPLVLLPQTLGPFKSRTARRVAGYILRKAVLVYSRDYSGLEKTKQFMGSSWDANKLRFCYDVGFSIDPRVPAHLDLDGMRIEKSDRPVVGLNISGLLYMGGYTKDNMFDLKIDYRSFVHDLIDYFARERDCTVLLIPHVFGSGADSESDSAVCEMIYGKLKPTYADHLYLARGLYDQNEIKYVIGLCDFFVGSRMHACIAAVSQTVPAIPVAYSEKFRGVMETIGMGQYVATPREMNEKQILALIDRAYEDRGTIKSDLEGKMPEVKECIFNLFNEIDHELRANRASGHAERRSK